jgi:hypothetical protein
MKQITLQYKFPDYKTKIEYHLYDWLTEIVIEDYYENLFFKKAIDAIVDSVKRDKGRVSRSPKKDENRNTLTK